jgi:predicted SAM-dependent methyltransferase
MNSLELLIDTGLHIEGNLLKLHLGCGATRKESFINIDFPQAEHNVFESAADAEADIVKDLAFPSNSVDEIYLAHVFEHFTRVEALALLIRWHDWLRIGGKLTIVVPDVSGCAEILTDKASDYKLKMCMIRHMVGDQAASWGFHLDGWFPERFENTFKKLGYTVESVTKSKWDHYPYLPSVEVIATKEVVKILGGQVNVGKEILKDSMVSEKEEQTWLIWCTKLDGMFYND